jgi:phage/plasmid primase-like uncharacterized protein
MMTPGHSEIESQVTAFMEAHGITPPRDGLIADGRIHRFAVESDRHGGKSGAYQIWPEGKSLNGRPHGWLQDHHDGGEKRYWQYCGSPLARAAGYHRAPEGRAEAEIQRQRENASKLAAAWSAYSVARPIEEATDHGYLLAKRVRPVGGFSFGGVWCGLRAGSMLSSAGRAMDNLLLIPLMDIETGKFCALHRVFPKPDSRGKHLKGWSTAAGGVFPVGIDVPRGPVFAAEGIATALAWYQYWHEESGSAEPCTVITAMAADNLKKQARAIRERYRGRDVFLLQDDDEAGERAAMVCAESGFTGVINPGDYLHE